MPVVFRKSGHDSGGVEGGGGATLRRRRRDHQPDQDDRDPGPDVHDKVVRRRDDRERHRERPCDREEP